MQHFPANFLAQTLLLFLVGVLCALILQRFLNARKPKSDGDDDDENELDLKEVLDKSPLIIWAERGGKVVWANKKGSDVFDRSRAPGLAAFDNIAPAGRESDICRIRLPVGKRNEAREFILTKENVAAATLFFASDASHLIESERELQRFIQTLTETFAHIPIGLAIFDKERDLSLFNPALSELLNLPAEWLIRRPSLMSFLDRLRNENIMPEPKDYSSFRRELVDLENGSVKGTYSAEWTLPTGLIYRVIGRPHLKGGMALLFEDISKAVIVERQYRAELERLYSVLDSLADGIAIFNACGELIFVNEAFDEMWSCDLAGSVASVAVTEVSHLLQKQCLPSPAWGDFRDFVVDANERSQWQASVVKLNGNEINMTFSPLVGGQVICEFKNQNLGREAKPKSQIVSA